MKKKIKAVQFGCGPIGCSIVRLAIQKPTIEIVGAVDLFNVGEDLGKVAGLGTNLGVIISHDEEKMLAQAKPDIVLHATGSSLEAIYPQLETIIQAKSNIVSTSEELSYPYEAHPTLSSAIDKLAKDYGVTVLATGVNPGFIMDTWPLAMTGVCQAVDRIRAVRVQDASSRRVPFQKKIGAGATREEFQKLVDEGTLRHVGLRESVGMIAAGLGWDLDDITETLEPVIAQHKTSSDYITVEPGRAVGVKQVGSGWKDGKEIITLDFQAYLGAKESYDAVYIKGTPDMEVVIKGGTHGDLATAAMIVNAIPRVLEAPPG